MTTNNPTPDPQFVHPYPAQAPAKKSKRFGFVAMAISVGASLAIGGCIGSAAGGSNSAEPAPMVTVTAEAPAPEAPKEEKAEPKKAEKAEKPSGIGEGIFEVGADIKPGRYKGVVPDDSIGCMYSRLKDDSGDPDSIITVDFKEPGSKVSVTIKKGDGFFETSGCGTWVRVK